MGMAEKSLLPGDSSCGHLFIQKYLLTKYYALIMCQVHLLSPRDVLGTEVT